MRMILLAVALAGAFAIAAPTTRTAAAVTTVPAISAATAPLYALQVPDKQIEITVNERGAVRWYRNPVWIALAAFGGVIILLLIILAVRGGGTTIIKE
jgi:biopolymer transport protein ExbD